MSGIDPDIITSMTQLAGENVHIKVVAGSGTTYHGSRIISLPDEQSNDRQLYILDFSL
jgi:hypothetical protein